jgi:hypothetical protein
MKDNDEFIYRCDKAIAELEKLYVEYPSESFSSDESTRIKGKIQGVKLAKQYYQELKRDSLI